MAFPVRGIIHHLYTTSWCNNSVLKLSLLPYKIYDYRNLNCKTHADSKNDAKSFFNASKSIGITKGRNIQNAVDTSVTRKDYRVLYRFPYIRVGGIVNRLKKHFTTVAILGVPTSLLLKLMDIISTDTVSVFIALGGVTCCVLYSVGTIFYKLVGSVYLSSDRSTVKISYLDFWGKRADVFCPVSDVVPLSEISERSTDVYVILRRYSTPQKLHFTLRFGTILDTELFADVFGDVNSF